MVAFHDNLLLPFDEGMATQLPALQVQFWCAVTFHSFISKLNFAVLKILENVSFSTLHNFAY